MDDPIAIYFLFRVCFCGPFLLCFLSREVPLAFVVNKAGLVLLSSLTFCLSVKPLISLLNTNELFAV